MPFFLRTIRKARWYKEAILAWLPTGDVPADPLADLPTQNNSLSVWYIEDDRSNLDEVLTALAANRDAPANLDYAIFSDGLVVPLQLKILQTEGNTPNNRVNSSWHRDLVELSASRLVELAKVIFRNAERKRVSEAKILERVRNAVRAGQIMPASLKDKIRSKI